MIKIIVFGDLPIATKVAQHLKKNENIDLVGCVIGNDNPKNNDPWQEVPLLIDYAHENKIPIYSLSQISTIFKESILTIGFSVRFSKIIRRDVLACFERGIVNFHGGLLPECGGLFSSCHAILQGHSLAGGTLHWIDEGIDTGNIIARAEFSLDQNDTSYSVFQRTQVALYEKFVDISPSIIQGNIKSIHKDNQGACYYNRSSLNGLREIDLLRHSTNEIWKRVRAFDFPGYEPAYMVINDRKIYMTLQRFYDDEPNGQS